MLDVTASYGTSFDFIAFFMFIFELLYLHQTFTDCVSNQCNILIYLKGRCYYKLWKVDWFNRFFGNYNVGRYVIIY